MTPNDLIDLETAFSEALTLAGEEREAFLAEFGRRRPELIEHLQRLIDADARSDDSWSEPIARSVRSMFDDGADPWIGRLIGSWRITDRIGSGGMAAVFRATRADAQFEQTAALKIMSPRLLDSSASARFMAERQLLANLNHPNIATLIDGGTTDVALPYLVMEYIEGEHIDLYADNRQLSITSRLRLFQKVCAAIDYAHRNLVVHRDIKPTNILVTGDGEPHLLDFGIAKVLAQHADGLNDAQTGEGARPMTLSYASPEQLRGEPVSIATDVYSLGVLLFHLLTGVSPYRPSPATSQAVEQAILTAEPEHPSRVLSSLPPRQKGEIAAARSTSMDRLRRTLAGDLDNVVLKCLEKKPERRYANARELSEDVDRFLTNRPVLARSAAWSYIARKFLLRNARPVAAAAFFVFAIAAVVSLAGMRLADERNKAELAAAEAEQIARFLTDIFKNADPFNSKGEPLTAIGLINSAESKLDSLADQPLLQARLAGVIGDTYSSLGDFNKAVELLEKSTLAQRPFLTKDPLAHGELLQDLAEAYRLSENQEAAERTIRESIAWYERGLSAGDPQLFHLYGRLAVFLADQGRKEEAFALLDESLRKRLRLNPRHDESSIDMLGNMAHVLVDLGRVEEGANTHLEVVRLSKEISGPLHPNTLIRTGNFALARSRQHRFEDAQAIYDGAIAGGMRAWPSNDPQIARWIGARALAKANLGKFDAAFADFETALAVLHAQLGERSDTYLAQLRNYSSALAMAGRWAKAADMLENAIAPLVADGMINDSLQKNLLLVELANVRNEEGRPEAALALLDQASKKTSWLTPLPAAQFNSVRAVTLSLLERRAQASALFEKVIVEMSRYFGEDGGALIRLYVDAAAHFSRFDELQIAEVYARRAHDIGRTSLPPGNWIAALATAEYARVLAALGEPERATMHAQEARAVLKAVFGPEDRRVVRLFEIEGVGLELN